MSTAEIRGSIESFRNLHTIFEASKTVAIYRLQQLREVGIAVQSESSHLDSMLNAILLSGERIVHPLLKNSSNELPPVIVLFGSENPFSGTLNDDVLARRKDFASGSSVALVGSQLINNAEFLNPVFTDAIPAGQVHESARLLKQHILALYHPGKQTLSVVYPRHNGEIVARQLLPLPVEYPSDKTHKVPMTFEPEVGSVVDHFVHMYILNQLFTMIAETQITEETRRLLVVTNASDQSDEQVKMLTRLYNRTRLERITKELGEIASALDAVEYS